jgi:hypothetical protein
MAVGKGQGDAVFHSNWMPARDGQPPANPGIETSPAGTTMTLCVLFSDFSLALPSNH